MARSERIQFPEWAYLQIGRRDNWTCHICKQGYKPYLSHRWQLDHDVALAKGGTNHICNLKLAHKQCNEELGAA